MAGLLGAWASLFATYLLLAGQASADEVAAGIGCASAAVAWACRKPGESGIEELTAALVISNAGRQAAPGAASRVRCACAA